MEFVPDYVGREVQTLLQYLYNKQSKIKLCNLLYALVEFLFIPALNSTTKEFVEVASTEIGTLPGKLRTYTFHISLISFKINTVLDDNYTNNSI